MLNKTLKPQRIAGQTLAVLLMLGALPERALASFITFTDRTAFENAASGAGFLIDTEDFATDPGNVFTVGGVEFDLSTDPVTLYDGTAQAITGTVNTSSPIFFPPVVLPKNLALGSTVGGGTSTWTGVGFDFSILPNSFDPTVEGDGGASLFIDSIGGDFVTPVSLRATSGFLGLLSTDGSFISNVNDISIGTDIGGDIFLDNLTVVNAPTSVPEPVTLLGTLTAGFGFIAFRRRQRS